MSASAVVDYDLRHRSHRFLAGVRRKMDLEQWTVGGRRFGTLLMYLADGGRGLHHVRFSGASGWAYSRGGPTLYILAYLTLAYVVSFFILPQTWEVGRKHGMQTISHSRRARPIEERWSSFPDPDQS
jgi:Na+/proline symporter